MGAAARALTPFRAPRKPVRCPGKDHADAALRRPISGSFAIGEPGYPPLVCKPGRIRAFFRPEPGATGTRPHRPQGSTAHWPVRHPEKSGGEGAWMPPDKAGHGFRFLACGQAEGWSCRPLRHGHGHPGRVPLSSALPCANDGHPFCPCRSGLTAVRSGARRTGAHRKVRHVAERIPVTCNDRSTESGAPALPRHPVAKVTLATALSEPQNPIPSRADRPKADQ